MSEKPISGDELTKIEELIDAWLAEQLANNPVVAAVDRGDGDECRWYVRVLGEEKDTYTIWFTLGQRTLSYETYVMPAPEENHTEFFHHLLRRNLKFYGVTFAVGAEDAIFLTGQLGNSSISHDELDRILGSIYTYVELTFKAALRIGFASRLKA